MRVPIHVLVGPPAAEVLIRDREFADEFGQQWIVGMASGVAPERGDDVPGMGVPVGVQRAGGLVAEHEPHQVPLAVRQRVEVGEQCTCHLVGRKYVQSPPQHKGGGVLEDPEQVAQPRADRLRTRRRAAGPACGGLGELEQMGAFDGIEA